MSCSCVALNTGYIHFFSFRCRRMESITTMTGALELSSLGGSLNICPQLTVTSSLTSDILRSQINTGHTGQDGSIRGSHIPPTAEVGKLLSVRMVKYLFPSRYNLQMLHLFLLCVSSITLLIIFASRPLLSGRCEIQNHRQILSKQNKEVSMMDKIFI